MFEKRKFESEIGTFYVNIGRGIRAHYHDGNRLWASKGRTIWTFDSSNAAWHEESKISRLSRLVCSELFNRLARSGIHNILLINDKSLLVVTKGQCHIIADGVSVDSFSFPRGNRPLRQGITVLNNRIYFGDYWQNPNRVPSNVYFYDLRTKRLEILVALKFARHIHFVQKSDFDENFLLIGTGDEDNEAGIYSCNTLSGELTEIGSGDQVWRAVSVIQRAPYLYWGMDSLDSQQYIIRFNIVSRELSILGPLLGPAYYSAMDNAGNLFIATTIEKKGAHRCCLYCSKDGEHWHLLAEWEKDRLHTKYFGYGLIEFIRGQERSSELFINLIGLRAQPIA